MVAQGIGVSSSCTVTVGESDPADVARVAGSTCNAAIRTVAFTSLRPAAAHTRPETPVVADW